eukprot:TRINITY_DN6677_c0_g1_i3.p1 TRINITY_DN6677_c0_g1~~TRINITY_DN6677_c0_g1_i3.p1  ORF type:complete len:373 (-),score=60.41 TRINITY_DN6677_c0_g1_i3:236-1354(-)
MRSRKQCSLSPFSNIFLGFSCGWPMDTAPQYNGEAFSTSWLGSVLGSPVSSVDHRLLTEDGGMMCYLQRIKVEHINGSQKTFIFKSITGAKLGTSRALGLVREATFYNSDLSKEFGSLIAKSYYAFSDPETGEKYILLEDLAPAIQSGLMFGPGNPNNWAKRSEIDVIASQFLGERTLYTYVEETFKGLARVHAKFWGKRELLSLEWLRASDWFSQKNDEAWKSIQELVREKWIAIKASLDADLKQPNGLQWDTEFITLLDSSVEKISWKDYSAYTQSSHWTLVTGDCHPANFLWVPEVDPKDAIKLVDFEMIGVGSGPQELAQYLISHMEPSVRRELEDGLLKAYYQELLAHGVKGYDWETCYKDYVQGGD